MGTQYGAVGGTSVTISGAVTTALPQPGSGQTIVTKYVENANTGTTVHTVTAGKIFYCQGVTLSCNSAADMGITVAGTKVLTGQVTTAQSVTFHGGIIFSATAGQAIAVTGIGAAENSATIWGIEVTA